MSASRPDKPDVITYGDHEIITPDTRKFCKTMRAALPGEEDPVARAEAALAQLSRAVPAGSTPSLSPSLGGRPSDAESLLAFALVKAPAITALAVGSERRFMICWLSAGSVTTHCPDGSFEIASA